jgi:hypothetical protein
MNSGKRLRRNIWRIDHLVFAYSTSERLDETRANMNAVLGLEPDDWDDLCQHVSDQWFCCLSASVRAASGKDRDQDGAPAA